jgi:tetratricopeptide (TPR) repeat protein
MKNLLIIFVFILSGLTTLSAQDFYLPVSTSSAAAKEAYYKAEQYASSVNFEEANAQLDKALQADPDFFMAYVVKIYYAPSEKRPAIIEKALAIDESSLNQAETIIRRQFSIWAEDPKAGIAENMKALVSAYPETPQAYQWASLHAAYTDKDVDTAMKYAKKLKALSPDFAPNYNTIGYMYMGKKKMNKARKAFESYIRLAPDDANAYDSMGEYYMNAKDYKMSAEYYDKAASMGATASKERADKAREMMAN